MFWISVLLITGSEGLFVSVGNYSDYLDFDINLPECGLGYVPTFLNKTFGRKCFYNGFPDIRIVENERNQIINSKRRQVSNRILQGTDSFIGESPWTVRLHIDGEYDCTGVLITFEWVMTAAHCVDFMTSYAIAYAGSIRREGKESIRIDMSKLFRHPFYINPLEANMRQNINYTEITHDMALVKLSKKFTPHLNDGTHYLINTVCLPKPNQTNENKEYATITGFGKINETSPLAEILQKAINLLAEYRICYQLIQKMFCSFISGKDLKGCGGDSGGPLVQHDRRDWNRAILVGIWRGTESNCTLNNPNTTGIWSAPTFHIRWILETIREN